MNSSDPAATSFARCIMCVTKCRMPKPMMTMLHSMTEMMIPNLRRVPFSPPRRVANGKSPYAPNDISSIASIDKKNRQVRQSRRISDHL